MRNRIREESGSITVEATISLSAFMFAIVTLLTIVNICIVQSKMSIAINATAKEISHYTYLYSLTGIHEAKANLAESAGQTKNQINDGVLTDVNDVFTEIQNLGQDVRQEPEDISSMLSSFQEHGANLKNAGGQLKEDLEELAKDPKGVAMGLVKIAATDGWDLATSYLIAAPLSKGLCKKNLVGERGGDVEAYLKSLNVVPHANGSYLDGLDFSKSRIFPRSSTEIRVTVSYDVKVIALLPIDLSFHFTQSATTQGWLCGDASYRTMQEVLENDSIWLTMTVQERVDMIRKQGIREYEESGYRQVSGGSYSDIHMYNPDTKEFLGFQTMNPLYSAEGETTKTLADISDTAIKDEIENMCAGINDSAKKLKTIETKKTGSDGSVTKKSYDCTENKQKIVLVIPTDEGLDTRIASIIETCDTRGVTIEIQRSYGNGARTTTVVPETEGGEE